MHIQYLSLDLIFATFVHKVLAMDMYLNIYIYIYIYIYVYIYYTRAKYNPVGKYTDNTSPEDEATFLTEWHCLPDLIEGLKSPCTCGMKVIPE